MTSSSSLCLAQLSDRDLLQDLKRLLSGSRQLEAELLANLAEVDARRLYLREACSSMFVYCTQVLHFSESTAYHRIAAARAARGYPALFASVGSGELHLSGVTLLAPHLTDENHLELIERAKHKTKRDIERIVADLRPRPTAKSVMRRLPRPRPGVSAPTRDPQDVLPVAPRPLPAPSLRPEALGGERFKIQFTADLETHGTLRELQALLRHQIPDGDLRRIFSRALALLLVDVKRKKFAETAEPRAMRGGKGQPTRHIPAEIKREVAQRDAGQCQYTSEAGLRCNAREFLEFHHTEPWARSPRHGADQIVLMCRSHNQYEAERVFGRQFMERHRLAPIPTAPGGS